MRQSRRSADAGAGRQSPGSMRSADESSSTPPMMACSPAPAGDRCRRGRRSADGYGDGRGRLRCRRSARRRAAHLAGGTHAGVGGPARRRRRHRLRAARRLRRRPPHGRLGGRLRVVALLIDPLVDFVDRLLPRWIAVIVVLLGVLGVVAAVAVGLANELLDSLDELQASAPRGGGRARGALRLAGRASTSPSGCRRSSTTSTSGSARTPSRRRPRRSPTYVVTGILMLFLLGVRPALLRRLRRPVRRGAPRRHPRRRSARRRCAAGCTCSWRSASRSSTGCVVGWLCWALDLPAAISLGFAVGVFTLLPLIGVLVGGIPALLLAFGLEGWRTGVVVLVALLVLQTVEAAVVRPYVDARTRARRADDPDRRRPARVRAVRRRRGDLRHRPGGHRASPRSTPSAARAATTRSPTSRSRTPSYRPDVGRERPQQRLQEQRLVGVALERLDGLVDPADGVDQRLRAGGRRRRRARRGSVPASTAEPAAQLVGAVPAQLALVALLEQLAAAAPLAELRRCGRRARRPRRPGARRAGRRRSSIWASSSSTSRITVAPVPSRRRGSSANARRRSTSAGSPASRRARSRSPPAAATTSPAVSASTPSATQPRREHVVGDRAEVDAHAARGDRDQVGRHEVGEHDERRRRRRLLDRLQQDAPRPPAGAGGTRGGSAPCGRPRPAPARPSWTISSACRLEMDGPTALDLAHVGVLAGEGQPGVAPAGVVVARQQQRRRTPGPPRASSSRAARRTGRRAPGRRRPRRSWATARRLADDVVPHARQSGSVVIAPTGSPTAARTRAATVVDVAGGVDDDPARRGRRPPSRGSRRRRGRGTRRRPARSGRGRGRAAARPARRRARRAGPPGRASRPPTAQSLMPAELVEVEAPAVALVGERRVHAAVADDGAPGGERRAHDLGDVLGPVGGGDQRLGAVVEVGDVGVVEDLRAAARRRRAAGLAGERRRPRPSASSAAWVLLPQPSAPSRAMYGGRLIAAHATPGPSHPSVRAVRVLAAGRSAARTLVSASWPAAFLAGGLLRRRLAGGPLRRGPALGGDLLAADRQQLVGPLGQHVLDAVALADRRVGLAVGDVHAELAVLGDDRALADRVGAELAQRALGGHVLAAAAEHLGLGEDPQRVVERDGEQLVLVLEVAEVAGPSGRTGRSGRCWRRSSRRRPGRRRACAAASAAPRPRPS